MEMKKLWCCVKSGLPILLRISSGENNQKSKRYDPLKNLTRASRRRT